jgi:predicted GH43/DUF377 family glycosyl hydrolase
MKSLNLIDILILLVISIAGCNNNTLPTAPGKIVSPKVMEEIFNEVKTPFKYGIIIEQPDSNKLIDSPTIFRENDIWYMTYIVFDGKGYETWLAESKDLLGWNTKGKILSFSENTWDANQKAGYPSLIDIEWSGTYSAAKFSDKYWMSYLGGNTEGYEAGVLKVGIAYSNTPTEAVEWDRIPHPVMAPYDKDARWFEKGTIFKSSIVYDRERHTGYPFVMFYNAAGDTAKFESIGMAVSDDMVKWKRSGNNPVITRHKGICGDAQITKIDDLFVMFYFGAFWKPGAFERFACSYDLTNWTEWEGNDLISPSEDFDSTYAHKPMVIKWNDVVYHFYNAVGSKGRVIALATSKDLKK